MIKQKLLPPLTSVNQGGRKEVSTVAREREEEGGGEVRQSRRWRRHFSGDNLLAKLKFINRPKRQAGSRQTRQRLLRLLSNFFCAVARCPLQHKHTHRTTKQSTKKPGRQGRRGR